MYFKYINNILFHKLHMLDNNTDMIWYHGRRLMEAFGIQIFHFCGSFAHYTNTILMKDICLNSVNKFCYYFLFHWKKTIKPQNIMNFL